MIEPPKTHFYVVHPLRISHRRPARRFSEGLFLKRLGLDRAIGLLDQHLDLLLDLVQFRRAELDQLLALLEGRHHFFQPQIARLHLFRDLFEPFECFLEAQGLFLLCLAHVGLLS